MSTALYRHFDGDGRLLYVGITHDPGRRWRQHAGEPWWHAVERTSIERHQSRSEALAAERVAIRTERPVHNVLGRDKPTRAREPVEQHDPWDYWLMGTGEIRRAFALSRQRVDQLAATDGFPMPHQTIASGRLWRTTEIVDWAERSGRTLQRP